MLFWSKIKEIISETKPNILTSKNLTDFENKFIHMLYINNLISKETEMSEIKKILIREINNSKKTTKEVDIWMDGLFCEGEKIKIKKWYLIYKNNEIKIDDIEKLFKAVERKEYKKTEDIVN